MADGCPIPWPTTTTNPPAPAAGLPTLVANSYPIPWPTTTTPTNPPGKASSGGLVLKSNCLLVLAGFWVAQVCWATPISMYWLGLAIAIMCSALLVCILVLLSRRNLLRTFPFFLSYVLLDLMTTIAASITLSRPHVYFYFFWITTPLKVISAILAVRESFRRVFRVFCRGSGFTFASRLRSPLLCCIRP